MRNWIKPLIGRLTKKAEKGMQQTGERIQENDLVKGIEADLSFIKSRLAPRGEESSFRTRDGGLAKMSQNRENIDRIMGRIREGKLNVRGDIFFKGYRWGREETENYCRWFAEKTEVPCIWAYNNTAFRIVERVYHFDFVNRAGERREGIVLYPFLPQNVRGSDGNPDDALKFQVRFAKVEDSDAFQAIPGSVEWRTEVGEKAKQEAVSEDELLEYADGYTLGVISAIFKRLTPDHKTPQLEEMLWLLNEPKG